MQEIEWIILELLARRYNVTAQQLYEALIQRGKTLPIDSIVMAKILAELGRRCDVKIPLNKETAATLKSVTALAMRVSELRVAQEKLQQVVG